MFMHSEYLYMSNKEYYIISSFLANYYLFDISVIVVHQFKIKFYINLIIFIFQFFYPVKLEDNEEISEEYTKANENVVTDQFNNILIILHKCLTTFAEIEKTPNGSRTINHIGNEIYATLTNENYLDMVKTITTELKTTLEDPIAQQTIMKLLFTAFLFANDENLQNYKTIILESYWNIAQNPETWKLFSLIDREVNILLKDEQKREGLRILFDSQTWSKKKSKKNNLVSTADTKKGSLGKKTKKMKDSEFSIQTPGVMDNTLYESRNIFGKSITEFYEKN